MRPEYGSGYIDTAMQEAVNVTHVAKQKMADGELYLGRAQQRYGLALMKVDSQSEKIADGISAGAQKMRDTVASPSFSIASVTAGLRRFVKNVKRGE
jgi:hypothetical protein